MVVVARSESSLEPTAAAAVFLHRRPRMLMLHARDCCGIGCSPSPPPETTSHPLLAPRWTCMLPRSPWCNWVTYFSQHTADSCTYVLLLYCKYVGLYTACCFLLKLGLRVCLKRKIRKIQTPFVAIRQTQHAALVPSFDVACQPTDSVLTCSIKRSTRDRPQHQNWRLDQTFHPALDRPKQVPRGILTT